MHIYIYIYIYIYICISDSNESSFSSRVEPESGSSRTDTVIFNKFEPELVSYDFN